ncbi:MAG: hypothetical protein WCP45_13210 [Verrucomicrobiota bacterium]
MSHRYKIFRVRASERGPVPGAARILSTSCSIGELLEKEISNLGGATAFGVEAPTFAWFVNARSHYLIFREDDSDFNIDLAMTQLARLPGQKTVDWFSQILGRMNRQRGNLPAILSKQGYELADDCILPHDGMGGVLLNKPSGISCTVFAAPPLPNLSGALLPQTAQDLLDVWFRQLTDILTSLKSSHGEVAIAFEVGGIIPIPDWFRDWCRDNDIKIFEFDP